MNSHDLHSAGRLWRVRAQLADRPGNLARLATAISTSDCNLLGVSVLPVSDASGTVTDELVLRAPELMTAAELKSLIEIPGIRCTGITTANAHDLVDAETSVLRMATDVLAKRATLDEVLRRLLAAEEVSRAPVTGSSSRKVAEIDERGHRMRLTLSNYEQIEVVRRWTLFTDGELARVSALLDLVDSGLRIGTPPVPEPTTELPRKSAYGAARQLSALDAQFLNLERDGAPLHVGNLIILDPTGLPGERVSAASVREVFANRMHMCPPLRWRLRTVPFGLDLPYWEDLAYVDLHHHVREIALPSPGDDRALDALVAKLAESRLDRNFPLWQLFLISGLPHGKQAIYAKVHHAIVDGISGGEVMAAILDLTPEPMDVPRNGELVLRKAPEPLTMALRAAQGTAGRLVKGIRALPHATKPVLALRRLAPRTLINQRISAKRAFTHVSLPLSEVKSVKNALGLTINDVVLALCSSALREFMLASGSLPDRAMYGMLPVSTRTPEQMGTAGNRISFMRVQLPTNEPNPLTRVEELSSNIAKAKAGFSEVEPTLLQSLANLAPQPMHGALTRLASQLLGAAPPPANLIISNVPGPQLPLYAAGARVTGCYPVSVIADVMGAMNITVMSYDGSLDFGIVACAEAAPDVQAMSSYLRAALDDLLEHIPAGASAHSLRH